MVGHDAIKLQYLPGCVDFPSRGKIQRIGPPESDRPRRGPRLTRWGWGPLLRRRELLRLPRLLDLPRRLHLLRRLHLPRILDRLSRPWLDLPRWRSLLRLLELLGLRGLTRLFPRSFLETMVRVSEAFELALVSKVFVFKASLAAPVAVLSRLLAPRAGRWQKEPR
jgi:hypothetical protein